MGLPWNHVAPLPLHTPGLWNTMIHDGFWILILSNAFHFADPGSPDHTFDTVCFLQSCDRHSWGKPNPLGAWGAHRGPCWSGASLEAQQHPTPLGWAWEHHSGGTWCSSGTIWWFLLFCRLLIIISNGAPPKWAENGETTQPYNIQGHFWTLIPMDTVGYPPFQDKALGIAGKLKVTTCLAIPVSGLDIEASAWHEGTSHGVGFFRLDTFTSRISHKRRSAEMWSRNLSYVCKCPHVPASSKLAHLILHDWPSLGVHTSNVTYLQLPEYFS